MSRTPRAATALSDHRELVRQQRRLILETRTLTITLRSALADLEAGYAFTDGERLAMRRAWGERVRLLLQDVRARSMQLAAMTAAVALDPSDRAEGAEDTPDAVLVEAERALTAIDPQEIA